jgi:hypothetical protein
MRKWITALILIVIVGMITCTGSTQKYGNASSANDRYQRDLIKNGNFTNGTTGWQISPVTDKAQYAVINIGADKPSALSMTAKHQESVQISQQVVADTPFVQFHFKANFLSTRGDGRIQITALDTDGRAIVSLGWYVVGDVPVNSTTAKWYDLRVVQNYLGDWTEQSHQLAGRFAQEFPGVNISGIRGYRVDLTVSDGQHGVFTDIQLVENRRDSVALTVNEQLPPQIMGEEFVLTTTITNRDSQPQRDMSIQAIEPHGWGLVVKEPIQQIAVLAPGESKTLTWTVVAQRPSLVNLDKAWELTFQIDGNRLPVKANVYVHDPKPGKIYYVLTDDLEPIDGAGYAKAYGNQNSWLDPEEFIVQLVQKAERLNLIAEKYGAKWSHYIAWPVVLGAEWAAGQSTTGAWPQAIEAVKQSVQNQSVKGHEYAIHMHSDYDPRLPGNILRYNGEVDGFWANHRRHGWAHNLPELGTFADIASRTGTLFDYQSRLQDLTRASQQGQIVATRVGSFDFGYNEAEEAKSIEAFRRAGLWAGSDADGNIGGITAGGFTESLYITRQDDINKPTTELRNMGILQFRPNPQNNISYDVDTSSVLNGKVDEGIRAYTDGGRVKAGIHAITGFTHTMFIMGEGGWKSLDGGQFYEIDRHLAHVHHTYVQADMMNFSTSSEMVKAYWDYYTPDLKAAYGPEQQQGKGQYIYPIRLIGSQIPVDARHIHTVTVKYPFYLRQHAYKVEIRKNGQTILKTWGLPTPYSDIEFSVDDATAQYTMHVYADPVVGKCVKALRWVWGKLMMLKNI